MQQPLEFYPSTDSQACPNDSKLTKKLRKMTKRAVKKSNKHKKREKELAIELYCIFKDADALDRFRLGPNGLDSRFLRTKEALDMVGFAKNLVRKTSCV